MKLKNTILLAATLTSLTAGANAATLLFADNFNESPANELASTFNDNLAATQSGTIVAGGPISYTVSGTGNAAQHSNGGNQLTLANFGDGNAGRVSLNNNFATQANSLDLAVVFSVQVKSITNFASDTSEWVSFSVGSSQNQFITGGVAGALFRANGGTEAWIGGSSAAGPTWNADDYITITLSGTGGVGSAFDGGGTVATMQIGSTNIGTFTISQQSDAFVNFWASSPGGNFGVGNFDNLSVTAIPEPGAALLGGLGLLALLRRRR